ncbi:hypothetical protein Ndes2437A_g04801 [Nannochloris sp. 'desiccata']
MGRNALGLAFLSIVCFAAGVHSDPTQRIYIAAEEIDWNYAPSGENTCKGVSFEDSGAAALWGSAGLGSTLKKAKFVAYTDDTFNTPVEIPDEEVHLGLLGPLIRGIPGDQIEVVLKNNVGIDLLLDPQGLVPLNHDNAPSPLGPVALPGETVTYTWDVPAEAAPGPEDPDTKLYLYRSVVYPEASDNAGLIGPILISRQGAPAKPEQGRDVITVMQILDENVSPFYDVNLGYHTFESLGLESEYAVEESLLKHAINGYVFCNIPGLNMTQNEQVRWHSAAMGSEGDMHNSHWHASTFLLHGNRDDQVKMFPGSTLSLDFGPREPGTWLLHCHVNDHIHAGMMALFNIAPDEGAVKAESTNGTVRKYYIAVDEVDWNYSPLGGDACETGAPQEWGDYAIPFVEVSTGHSGPRYLKAQYVEYTDDTFTTKVARSEDEEYMGILGPIIRAEVGDIIDIVFRNNLKSLDKAVSIHPHGVAYDKSAEGAYYNDGTTGSARLDDLVLPNTTVSVTWQVPETAGPGPNDPSTIGWMYHSHSDEVADPLAGLVGMIVIGRPGSMQSLNTTSAGGSKRDAGVAEAWLDRGRGADERTAAASAAPSIAGRKLLQEAPGPENEEPMSLLAMAEAEEVENDLMHGVNGYIYCNGPPLKLNRGDAVRFHVMAIGTQVDMHSATLAGSNFDTNGQRGPAVSLLAGSMHTSDVAVVAPAGPAVLQCRVADHIEAGMQTLILVEEEEEEEAITRSNSTATSTRVATSRVPPLSTIPANATRRPYFVQTEETRWDYVPKGRNLCGSQGPEPFNDGEALFVEQIPGETIGTEVGDIIEITFKNTLDFEVNLKFDAGFVPMQYSADVNAGVAPGELVKYILAVPESAGPCASDLNTVTYGYTSSVDLVYHPYSGLVGIALVGAPGAFAGLNAAAMPSEPVPAGADKMLPLLLGVMNEGETLYLEKNAADAGVELVVEEGARHRLLQGEAEAEAEDGALGSPDFEESNLMHGINGYMFCNMPEVHVESGKVIRVASLGMGSEVDIHSVVFSGQSLLGTPQGKSPRGAVEPLMPSSAISVDLKATQPGRWLFSCTVHDHDEAGMKAVLSVDTAEEAAALAEGNSPVSSVSASVGGGRGVLALWMAAFVAIIITQLFI